MIKSVSFVLLKIFLVALTLLFLSSMGGAMAFGAPILVPLQGMAANSAANGWTRGGWIFLAGISIWEASWMYAYVLFKDDTTAVVVGIVISLLATIVLVAGTNPRSRIKAST